MSRIVQIDGVGKQRNVLCRSILQAIQELMREKAVSLRTRDLAAYIVLALHEVYETIETSVTAWEKRGYWLKADRFRMEWEWSERLGEKMRVALMAGRWDDVAALAVQVAGKLGSVKVPKRAPKIEIWEGAWDRLNSKYGPKR